MAKRSDGRTSKGTFRKGTSGNPSGIKRGAQKQDQQRSDGYWTNPNTGQGVWGRDKSVGAHFQLHPLTFDELKDLWLGDDLAARAVEVLPKEAMRQGYDLVIPSSADGDSFDPAELASEIMAKLDLLGADNLLEVAAMYERAYGGGAVLLGVNDKSDDLTKPLDLDKVASIDYLTPLEARECLPLYAYADPRAPKYGQPEIYQLQSRAVLPSYSGQYAATTMQIHESRLLVFPGIKVSRYQITTARGGWGESTLNRLYRVLRDFNTAWSSAGVLVTDFAQSVRKIAGLWQSLALDGGKAFQKMLAQMEFERSVTNVVTIDAADSYERQQTPLTGLPDLLEKFAVRLAAACDMPLTLLFGTSPAGMNATGDSDIRFFYDRVAAYQHHKIEPQLRQLIKIIFRVVGNKKEPDQWSLKFRPLWQESAKDKAGAMLTQAQADTAWITAGVLSPEEVAAAHWGKGEYDPNLSVDFEARDDEEQAAAPPVPSQEEEEPVVPPPAGYTPPPAAGSGKGGPRPVAPPGPAAAPDPATPPKPRGEVSDIAHTPWGTPWRTDVDWSEEDHPRGEHGRFGAGSGGKSAEELAATAKAQGGFTYDPEHGGMPKEGYALSIHQGHEHVIKSTELTPDALREYLGKHGDFIKANPGAHVGAWYDEGAGKWYLDVSHVTNNRAEAESLAKANNQEAFYDLAKHETVYVKSGADRRIDTASATRRRQEAALRPEQDDAGGDASSDARARGSRQSWRLDDIGPDYIIQQLEDDFPESSLGWVRTAHWSGPELVDLDDVDYANASSWRASHEPEKVDKFAKRIRGGWIKPVVLVKRPSIDKLMIADGHHRALAYRKLGMPMLAFVAHVAQDEGPWDEFHSAQHEGEHVGEDRDDNLVHPVHTTSRVWNDGPSWASDPDIWAKAEEVVDPTGKGSDYDDPWAVVAAVYKRMGGAVKDGGESMFDAWSEEAREAALETRRANAKGKTEKPAAPAPTQKQSAKKTVEKKGEKPAGKKQQGEHTPQHAPAPGEHPGKHGGEHAPGKHGEEGRGAIGHAVALAHAGAEIIGGKAAAAVTEGAAEGAAHGAEHAGKHASAEHAPKHEPKAKKPEHEE